MENNNTRTRETRRNARGQWFYRETESYANGNTYTNYYRNCTTHETPDEGHYNSTTEQDWNNQTWEN